MSWSLIQINDNIQKVIELQQCLSCSSWRPLVFAWEKMTIIIKNLLKSLFGMYQRQNCSKNLEVTSELMKPIGIFPLHWIVVIYVSRWRAVYLYPWKTKPKFWSLEAGSVSREIYIYLYLPVCLLGYLKVCFGHALSNVHNRDIWFVFSGHSYSICLFSFCT